MNRLDELLLLWQDQSITEDEVAELKKLLSSPEGRARVAGEFFLTGVVLESLQTQKAARELLTPPKERPNPEDTLAPSVLTTPVSRSRRRARLAGAAAVLLVALGAGVWLWTRPSPPPPIPTTAFAQFEQVQGDTFVVSRRDSERDDTHTHPEQKTIAQAGQVLIPGQGISTEGADSEAVVQMKDAVRLTLGGDTTVFTAANAEGPNAGGPKVVLEQGDLLVEVTRSLRKRKTTVQTPLGVAVTETEETALHVSDAAGVIVVRGEVTFVHKGTGKSIRLKGGQYVVVGPDGNLHTAQLFSGSASLWTAFPQAGLDTGSLGYRVAFSPDGKRLAAVSRNGEGGVRLGGVEGQPSPLELQGERCVSFSPDGKLLATANLANVLLHDIADGKPVRILTVKERRIRVICLAFSLDGKSLAVGRGVAREPGEVEIWDVTTGTLRTTWRGHASGVTSLAFSPDGKRLASGSLDNTTILWDTVAGQERLRIPGTPGLVVWSVTFAPDGKTLAIAAGTSDFRLRQPGVVALWDTASEKVCASLRGHTRAVTSVVFSADGQTLITGSSDTTVRFWDATTGREYGMLKPHKAAPGFEALAVALAPDGTHLATASFDRTVKLWKTTWIKNDARASAQGDLNEIDPRHPTLTFLARP